MLIKFLNRKLSVPIFVIMFIIYTLSALYSAEVQTKLVLTSKQEDEIKKIDTLYNSFKTVRSRFVQKDSLGNSASGWFVLEKPGKLRVEYDNIPIRFIASGANLLYQDIKLKQKSFIPIKSTPFYYLLKSKSSFLNKDIAITEYEVNDTYTKITFVTKKAPAMGSLTLFLTSDTAQIIKWNILDAKGITTEIFLSNPKFSVNAISNATIFNVQRIKDVDFNDAK